MTNYKLHYFDIYILGEPIKFLFLYGKLPYEQKLISHDWPQVKNDYTFGKVPVLEFDGKHLNQSNAICRYLAKKMGLAGSNDWESAQIDAIADTIQDMRLCIFPHFKESDDAVAEQKLTILKTVEFPFYLEKFDKTVADNGGYFVNGKLSWADFMFVGLCDYFSFFAGEDVVSKYKHLSQMKKNVEDIPAIKQYLAQRPPKAFLTRADLKGYT